MMARKKKNEEAGPVTAADPYDVSGILARHPRSETALIEILHDIQGAFRHLPKEKMKEVAAHCGVHLSKVASVATFYTAFSFEKKGQTVIRICLGTACHVKGGSLIKDEAERQLGITAGQTTADGKFTLEVVNCVGACAMAPLVIRNEKYFGKFKAIELRNLLGSEA
jgi:NADH-quinone oxidoreductase subunit E